MSVSTALRLRDRRRKGSEIRRKGKSQGNSSSRGGGTPYDGLYGVAPPERGIFFRFQVYGRVEKSVIWVSVKVAQRANR